jgi:hypothetical protein
MDKETGEVLDDAQGYGYKTAPKAYAAYAYKTRDKSKDQEIMDRRKHIRAWMKEHKSFVNAMDVYAFEIAKGSWGPDDKFDSKFVAEMLKENNLEPDFTAGELLHEWKKVPPEVEERKRKRKKKKKKHIQKEDE